MTPLKSNLFIHFGNANHEYFKPMLNTHRTIQLHTLTALSDKWVHIRRGIGPKVNTVGKVGELNWCSPSRGSLVESLLRRDDRGYFMDASGIFCFFDWTSIGREKNPQRWSFCSFLVVMDANL